MKRTLHLSLILLASSLLISGQTAPSIGPHAAVKSTYGSLPLSFEPNLGQAASPALFVAHAAHANILVTAEGLIVASSSPAISRQPRFEPGSIHTFQIKLLGSNAASTASAADALPGKSNYLRGSDPGKWLRNIPTYARVRVKDIYPGVDMVYYGKNQQLEYDFSVAPQTDPGQIRFRIEGAEHVSVARNGDLLLNVANGTARLKKPYAYQTSEGGPHQVRAGYVLDADGVIRFAAGPYDRKRTLIIDPALDYSTYLGGSFQNDINGLAIDSAGNAYVAGFTTSTDFPITPGSFQTTCQANCTVDGDAFVTKLNATGDALIYSTYLGGTSSDEAMAVAIDSAGNAYVTGETFSSDFPLTASAFQSTPGGDFDIFVSKLDPTGSTLLYSTLLGGFADDNGTSIAVDNAGNAFIGGHSFALSLPNNFPITPGAFQTSAPGNDIGIVARVDTNASGAASLVYSSFLGGSFVTEVFDLALDSSDNVYVTGETESTDFPVTPGAFRTQCIFKMGSSCSDAFVTKFNPLGTAAVYSTYLGGSSTDDGNGIAVDAAGHAFVVGDTRSTDFPLKNPFQKVNRGGVNGEDAFVTELNLTGSKLEHSTYLGGNQDDVAFGVAIDASGNAYVTGITESHNFPLKKPLQSTIVGQFLDHVFVSRFNEAGNKLVFSTFLGGSGLDVGLRIRADSTSHAYVTGFTDSTDFPVTPGAFQTTNSSTSGFVTKICILVCP